MPSRTNRRRIAHVERVRRDLRSLQLSLLEPTPEEPPNAPATPYVMCRYCPAPAGHDVAGAPACDAHVEDAIHDAFAR